MKKELKYGFYHSAKKIGSEGEKTPYIIGEIKPVLLGDKYTEIKEFQNLYRR